MEFYEVLKKRRTSREWLDKDVDLAVVKRILDAANNAQLGIITVTGISSFYAQRRKRPSYSRKKRKKPINSMPRAISICQDPIL